MRAASRPEYRTNKLFLSDPTKEYFIRLSTHIDVSPYTVLRGMLSVVFVFCSVAPLRAQVRRDMAGGGQMRAMDAQDFGGKLSSYTDQTVHQRTVEIIDRGSVLLWNSINMPEERKAVFAPKTEGENWYEGSKDNDTKAAASGKARSGLTSVKASGASSGSVVGAQAGKSGASFKHESAPSASRMDENAASRMQHAARVNGGAAKENKERDLRAAAELQGNKPVNAKASFAKAPSSHGWWQQGNRETSATSTANEGHAPHRAEHGNRVGTRSPDTIHVMHESHHARRRDQQAKPTSTWTWRRDATGIDRTNLR